MRDLRPDVCSLSHSPAREAHLPKGPTPEDLLDQRQVSLFREVSFPCGELWPDLHWWTAGGNASLSFASMGPPLDGDGCAAQAQAIEAAKQASMGPPLDGDGCRDRYRQENRQAEASMGPPLDGDGCDRVCGRERSLTL